MGSKMGHMESVSVNDDNNWTIPLKEKFGKCVWKSFWTTTPLMGVNKANNKNPLAIWYLTRDSISKLLTDNSVYSDITNPGFAVKESV